MGLRSRSKEEREAIDAFAKSFPNSIVSDLLMHFSDDVVLLLVELYEGRDLYLPHVKSIWISYRNKKIKDVLDYDNSDEAREKLCENFGLNRSDLSSIYIHSKRGYTKVKFRTIQNIVETIYRRNLRDFYKGLRRAKEHDSKISPFCSNLNNPEFLYFMKEQRTEFIERCVKDINSHLVFADRELQRERAIHILLGKTCEDF